MRVGMGRMSLFSTWGGTHKGADIFEVDLCRWALSWLLQGGWQWNCSCSTRWVFVRLGEYTWCLWRMLHSLVKGYIFPHAFSYGGVSLFPWVHASSNLNAASDIQINSQQPFAPFIWDWIPCKICWHQHAHAYITDYFDSWVNLCQALNPRLALTRDGGSDSAHPDATLQNPPIPGASSFASFRSLSL